MMQSPQNYSAASGAQQKSAIGMQGNLAAALGYPIGILGLVSAIIEKDNKFVKFHGFQSLFWGIGGGILLFIAMFVVGIIGTVVAQISAGLGLMVWGLGMLALVAIYLGALLFAAFKAYQGQMFKLPIIGNIAEKLAFK